MQPKGKVNQTPKLWAFSRKITSKIYRTIIFNNIMDHLLSWNIWMCSGSFRFLKSVLHNCLYLRIANYIIYIYNT